LAPPLAGAAPPVVVATPPVLEPPSDGVEHDQLKNPEGTSHAEAESRAKRR
jgi:hypothetical protein